MSAFLRVSGKIVAALAGLLVFLFLIAYVINSHDEELTPETGAMLAAPSNPWTSEDNIYVALAGLDAPSGESVVDVGSARIGAYNHAIESMELRPDNAMVFCSGADSTRLAFRGDLSLALQAVSIWEYAKSHRTEIAALLASNQELYRRYRAMHALHGYYETALPSILAPPVYAPSPLRALFLTDVSIRMQTGAGPQQRAALDELGQDLRMWHIMLKGDGPLVSKMIAVAAIHADILVLADLIADSDMEPKLLAEAQGTVLSWFDLSDWKIGKVFDAEFRAADPLIRSIPLRGAPIAGRPSWLGSWWRRQYQAFNMHFFKVNASENLNAAQMIQLHALADSDPARFSRARKEFREWLRRNDVLFTPTIAYNPIGKILVRIWAATYENYPVRVYDVFALQRLVYLAAQVRLLRIDAPKLRTFMVQHPEWSRHPIDGAPFRWNPATGELAMTPIGTYSGARRFSLKLYAPVANSLTN